LILGALYNGENLLPGQFGHVFILLSFVAGLFACFTFSKAANTGEASWNKLGRFGFWVQSLSVFAIIGVIFYAMISNMYEYSYVYEHVSDELPMRYIFSAFWEGQEGSFLLWMFWHAILGMFILRNRYSLESHVMAALLMVQTFLSSMLLGVYIGSGEGAIKIGSNPLLLLRQTMDAPIFSNPDYVSMIEGTGLNPLLQNYWMTIHPPTLFLGFASVTIPFAFAIAGLWSGRHKEWLGPALKWALFCGCILGTGILMGGAWAYEALTFGGYWAWDPVENMSLVPWLIMVAGIHANLISKSTGYSIKTSYLLYMFSFVLILYSTFLTRSGVLGETSVHAFTNMGLEWQLVALVGSFFVMSLAFFFYRFKQIPSPKKEETIYSREFWMYIGAIVLLFSGVIISASTSLPVYNKIQTFFDPEYIGKVIDEPIPHYNKYQIWIACFVTILSSAALWMRYKGFGWENIKKKFITHNFAMLLLAGVITYLMTLLVEFFEPRYVILNVLCVFAILVNTYLLLPTKWKSLKSLAAATSHLGFALMIVGSIVSSLNETTISSNPFALKGLVEDESLAKIVQLIKGEPFYANNYWMTYESDTIIGKTRFFEVDMRKVDDDGNTLDQFKVTPNVIFTNDMKKVAAPNPDTKHYLFKDIFTQIPALPAAQQDIELAQQEEDSLNYELYNLMVGDTFFLSNSYGIVESLSAAPDNENFLKEENELGVQVNLKFNDMKLDTSYYVNPALGLDKNLIFTYPERINSLNVKAKISDEFFSSYFTEESKLDYTNIDIGQNESFNYKDWTVQLLGMNTAPQHANYIAEENDIAVAANLIVKNNTTGETYELNPVYIIRGNKPMIVKDYHAIDGLHIKFLSIEPSIPKFYFAVASDKRDFVSIPVYIAEKAPRSDWIAFQAVIFPGINLFWLGSILMMSGFAFSFISRLKSKL